MTGQMITRNSKHIKITQITAKHYLWDPIEKHRIIYHVQDILKQFGNQAQKNKTYTHSEQLNYVPTGNNTSDTQQQSTQHNNRNNHNQKKR